MPRYKLSTLFIGSAIGLIVAVLLLPPFGRGDGWPKASRTASDVKDLSLLCESLNERGFDFESIDNIRGLLDACASASKYRYAEFEGDWYEKTPYGGKYQYKYIRTSDGCFVEISAEVPDNVPKRFKDMVRKRIEVKRHADKNNTQSRFLCSDSQLTTYLADSAFAD